MLCYSHYSLFYYYMFDIQRGDHHSLLFSSPSLQGTDGINLCNTDDGSQSFQSSTTTFSNLQRRDDVLCDQQSYICQLLPWPL